MIAVDTDVLVIHHVFKDDPRFAATADFLNRHAPQGYSVPIFSLLELCGIIATARQPQEALLLLEEYLTSPTVQVLYPPMAWENATALWAHQNAELMKRIQRGMRLGDAAILWTVESTACDALVTWNTKHYRQKTPLKVQTPEEWLKANS
jgi:hypothetical protein